MPPTLPKDFPEHDPERALEYYKQGSFHDGNYCTMCGPNFCAMRLSQDITDCIEK